MKRFVFIFFIVLNFNFASQESNSCSNIMPTVTFAEWGGSIDSLINGYYVWDSANCWWIPGVITHSFWQDTPLYYSTRAIWQAEGVMEFTAEWKGITLDNTVGFIAINSCAYDGNLAFIRPPNFDWIAVKVVDCANRLHAYYHAVPVDSALELNYALADSLGVIDRANEYGGVGLLNVQVCLIDLSFCQNNNVVDYKEWFLDQVQFEIGDS